MPPIKIRTSRRSNALPICSADTSAANANVKIETTAFPSGIAMASSWDTDLVQREGRAIAQEIKTLGRDMILGPTVNINRQSLQTGQHTPNYRRSKRHGVCD
jgi:beta-glucosidase-like glycosyl hydrolase